VILPQHLPLQTMGRLMGINDPASPNLDHAPESNAGKTDPLDVLISDLRGCMPEHWPSLTYREAQGPFVRAFDRVYLKGKLEQSRYNITQAAKEADVDTKTFRRRWKESGLGQLEDDRGSPDIAILQTDFTTEPSASDK
jgi:hypothetical protein